MKLLILAGLAYVLLTRVLTRAESVTGGKPPPHTRPVPMVVR